MDDHLERLWDNAALFNTTKRSAGWTTLPGGLDTVHSNIVFPGDGPWDIPMLEPELTWPTRLFGYAGRHRSVPRPGDAIHFFREDYKFEIFWKKPRQVLPVVQKVGMMLSPEFSVNTGIPRSIHLWNIHRNRWLGRYAQVQGVKVIPTALWTDEASWEYAFYGIPQDSLVAVSTQSFRSRPGHAEELRAGIVRLVEVVRPRGLVVYGTKFELPPLPASVEVRRYPTDMDELRAELAQRPV